MYFVQRLNSHSSEANSLLTSETRAMRSSYRDLPPTLVPPSAAARVDLQNRARAASMAPGPRTNSELPHSLSFYLAGRCASLPVPPMGVLGGPAPREPL